MVAVGNLKAVWLVSADEFTDDEFTDMESLSGNFEEIFGGKWLAVVAGGDRTFSYHQGWEAYFAVSGLSRCHGPRVSNLKEELKTQGAQVYNTIVG